MSVFSGISDELFFSNPSVAFGCVNGAIGLTCRAIMTGSGMGQSTIEAIDQSPLIYER
jgi:hypothetical protein